MSVTHLPIHRSLAILCRLQRGATARAELVDHVLIELGESAYPEPESKACQRAFEQDIKRLRDWGVELAYERTDNEYQLIRYGDFSPVGLDEAALDALAFLAETFAPDAPNSETIQRLIYQVSDWLPANQGESIPLRRQRLRLDLQRRDNDVIAPSVEATINRAITQHRLLRFAYRSPQQSDGQPRVHTVQPWGLIYDTTRRHLYLDGYRLVVTGPFGEWRKEMWQRYRLGRIVADTVEILPTKFATPPPKRPRYRLEYWLAPELIRLGEVTAHFDEMATHETDSTILLLSVNAWHNVIKCSHCEQVESTSICLWRENMTEAKTESKWQVLRRCLAIIQRLQIGPSTRDDLMEAVREVVPGAYDTQSKKAKEKRLQRDLQNLRDSLYVEIECPAPDYQYRLIDSGPFAGISLSDDAIQSLAFLINTFDNVDYAGELVKPLFDFMRLNLSVEQRHNLSKYSAALELTLQQLDSEQIPVIVWEKVNKAVSQRRLLRFHYVARRYQDEQPRVHTIEPYILRLHKGHYELKAYCRHWSNPYGYERRDAGWFRYRLENIQTDNITILEEVLPAEQRKLRLISVRYKLSPRLASGSVSHHFEETNMGERDEEGWIEVSGKTDDIFEAERVLLAYGEHCIVLEPHSLARKMYNNAQQLLRLYQHSLSNSEGYPNSVG